MLFGDVLPKQLKRLVGRSFRVSGFGFRMDDEAVSRRTFCRMRGLASKGKDILLPSGKVSIDNIAARQHMSVRTLQRRLRDWGFAFEEIVDDVRRTEAIRHVLAGENSAMEIA
jgi:AraC-like DNA-binding protein